MGTNHLPPPPSYCNCGHRRMDHPRSGPCRADACECFAYDSGQ